MTTTNVDRLVEERLDLAKLTDAYERNGLMGVQELARSALSQARQEGREEEREKITGIVEEWMKTSNPAHAQDLFDALTTEGK